MGIKKPCFEAHATFCDVSISIMKYVSCFMMLYER
jgi:hypothetical protein